MEKHTCRFGGLFIQMGWDGMGLAMGRNDPVPYRRQECAIPSIKLACLSLESETLRFDVQKSECVAEEGNKKKRQGEWEFTGDLSRRRPPLISSRTKCKTY
jgi:hypothetical protein